MARGHDVQTEHSEVRTSWTRDKCFLVRPELTQSISILSNDHWLSFEKFKKFVLTQIGRNRLARGGKPRKIFSNKNFSFLSFVLFFSATKVNKYTKAGRLSPNRITQTVWPFTCQLSLWFSMELDERSWTGHMVTYSRNLELGSWEALMWDEVMNNPPLQILPCILKVRSCV